MCGLSLLAASGGNSLVAVHRLLTVVASPVERGLKALRVQLLRLMGSRVWAQFLKYTNFVALQHVGSSQTRDQACVLCIGKQVLNHRPNLSDSPNFHY